MKRPLALALLALFMSAVSPAALAHEQALTGSEWGVLGEDGPAARFVSFAGSGRLFGFAGCNRFTGSFEQHDEHVTISALATTRMACPDDAMTREREFLDLLGKVRKVRTDHTILLLLDEEGRDLRALSLRHKQSGGDE